MLVSFATSITKESKLCIKNDTNVCHLSIYLKQILNCPYILIISISYSALSPERSKNWFRERHGEITVPIIHGITTKVSVQTGAIFSHKVDLHSSRTRTPLINFLILFLKFKKKNQQTIKLNKVKQTSKKISFWYPILSQTCHHNPFSRTSFPKY